MNKKTIKNKYHGEIEDFLSKYNVSETRKIIILNIFNSYLNSMVDKGGTFYNDTAELENTIRCFMIEYERKINQLLNNNGIHRVFLNYIIIHKQDGVSFETLEEECLYDEIVNKTFFLEVYCLVTSDYNNLCMLLHQIANKLGFIANLKQEIKDKFTDQIDNPSFVKLRKAIKEVE